MEKRVEFGGRRLIDEKSHSVFEWQIDAIAGKSSLVEG